jgi:hypothetical protein
MQNYEVTVTVTYGITAESPTAAKQVAILHDFTIPGHDVLMVDYDYAVEESEEEV